MMCVGFGRRFGLIFVAAKFEGDGLTDDRKFLLDLGVHFRECILLRHLGPRPRRHNLCHFHVTAYLRP